MNKYNHEHYPDLTAQKAIENANKQPGRINEYIHFVKQLAKNNGLEITNRIHVRDLKSGKEYR